MVCQLYMNTAMFIVFLHSTALNQGAHIKELMEEKSVENLIYNILTEDIIPNSLLFLYHELDWYTSISNGLKIACLTHAVKLLTFSNSLAVMCLWDTPLNCPIYSCGIVKKHNWNKNMRLQEGIYCWNFLAGVHPDGMESMGIHISWAWIQPRSNKREWAREGYIPWQQAAAAGPRGQESRARWTAAASTWSSISIIFAASDHHNHLSMLGWYILVRYPSKCRAWQKVVEPSTTLRLAINTVLSLQMHIRFVFSLLTSTSRSTLPPWGGLLRPPQPLKLTTGTCVARGTTARAPHRATDHGPEPTWLRVQKRLVNHVSS